MNKNIYLTALILFISIQFSTAQTWTEINPGFTGENYIAVDFPTSTTGYISGYNGNIIKTVDNGDTWSQLTTGEDITLECVEFLDENNGFAAGSGDVILSTTDGGATWNTEAVSGYKYGLSFPSVTIGYVCGADGIAYKYESNAWTELTTGTTRVLYDAHFHDNNTGYLFGGFFDTDCRIIKTIDGGASWTTIDTPNEDAIFGVHFPTASIGYAVGWDGNIIKTIDGGDTWSALSSGSTEVLQKVCFIDENIGYVTGNSGTLLKTTDGGSTWQQETITITDDLYGTYFIDADNGYVVGTNENILKYAIVTGISNNNESVSFYPNPADNYISFKSLNKNNDFHTINIYDISGKKVISYKITNGKYNIESLTKGIYFTELIGNKNTLIQKFIKQ